MATIHSDVIEKLAKEIRDSRERLNLSQEYVALRLGRTKGWLSKIENNKLRIDPETLRKSGQLFGWTEEEIEAGIRLLGPSDYYEKGRKELVLEHIRGALEELQRLSGEQGMAHALYETYKGMSPDPTLPFLLFVSDSLDQAIKHEVEQSGQ